MVLGTDRRCPSESAIRRLLGKVDGDRFDTVIGGYVQTLTAAVAPAGRRRVLAVDGKTLRGSRHTDTHAVVVPGRHADTAAGRIVARARRGPAGRMRGACVGFAPIPQRCRVDVEQLPDVRAVSLDSP